MLMLLLSWGHVISSILKSKFELLRSQGGFFTYRERALVARLNMVFSEGNNFFNTQLTISFVKSKKKEERKRGSDHKLA